MAVKYVLRPSAANSGTNTSHQLSVGVNMSARRATSMLNTSKASKWRKSSKVAKPSHWTNSLRENSIADDSGVSDQGQTDGGHALVTPGCSRLPGS